MARPKREYSNYDPRFQNWATLPIDDLLPVLLDKIEDYYERLQNCGLLQWWQEMYNMYYGLSDAGKSPESHKIMFIGDNDEGIKVRSGHMRNILQHIYISATAQEPNFTARAVNNDLKSMYQTYAAKSVLEYFMYERNVYDAYTGAAEICLPFRRGYVWQAWDLIRKDIIAEAHTPLTVISDLSNKNPNNPQWYIVVERANKWDIVEKYDIEDDDLEELCEGADIDNHFVGFDDLINQNDDDDYINVFHFYYKKTPGVPKGRYVAFINEKLSLYPFIETKEGKEPPSYEENEDDRLPYAELPVYMIEHGRMFASPHSHSVAHDIAAHEKLHNIALSTIHTQVNKHGKKVLTGPKKPNWTDYGGLEYFGIEAGERPISAVDLTAVSETLFKLAELEQGQMELLSAMNAAIRGNTEGQKSGSHAALLHSVAVQFQSGFHQRYNQLLQRCGTGLVRLLKEFYEEEKMIEIVGMDGIPHLKAFSREQIEYIDRVIVENGPSVLRTMAGKLHFADSMLEKGMIQSPQDYQEVLDTGQLQGLLTPARRKNSGIQAENEKLMQPESLTIEPLTDGKGQPIMEKDGVTPVMVVREVRVLLVDDDPTHINEHANLLLDPDFRQNELLVQAVLTHITEHIWLAQNTPPHILAALGKRPLPSGQPQLPNPGMPPGPPPQPNQPGAPPQGPPALSEQNLQQQAGNVPDPNYPLSGMPGMPINPIG